MPKNQYNTKTRLSKDTKKKQSQKRNWYLTISELDEKRVRRVTRLLKKFLIIFFELRKNVLMKCSYK